MEIDELEKRIAWLDAERQKDKKRIIELTDELTVMKEENSKQSSRINSFESELKSIKKIAPRADKVEADFAAYKTEVLKQINDLEKKVDISDQKKEKLRKDDLDSFNKKMLEFQTDVKTIAELKKTLQMRSEEALTLSQKVDEISKSHNDLQTTDSDLQRQQRVLVNDLSIENKRLNDLQLETSAIRKRIEEDRNLTDLHKELIRKIETRLTEFQNNETERKQNQVAFIEKQNMLQLERDNSWKEWQKRLNDLEGLGTNFNTQLADLEETNRSVKRAQQEFEEINERFNRRINEITEMNRLSEERFRQEWVAFKADDQKRWTNYTLSREEEQRESDRQMTRILDRLVALEDLSQELNDTMHLVNEETQKQMRGFLTLTQEMLDSYSQSVGKRIK